MAKHTNASKEQAIDKLLEQERIDAQIAFAAKMLEKAEIKLEKANKRWDEAEGYGSRTPVYNALDQVRLCRLAVKGAEMTCNRCESRRKNIYIEIEKIKKEQEQGITNISTERILNILRSFI